MKSLTYEQAYIKCLDIASAHAEREWQRNSHIRAEEAWRIYQEQGALMLQLPMKRKKKK